MFFFSIFFILNHFNDVYDDVPLANLVELLRSRAETKEIDANALLSLDDNLPINETFHGENWEEELIDNYVYELNHQDDKEELDEEGVEEIAKNANFVVPLRADVRKMIETIEGFVVAKEPLLFDMFQTFKTAFIENSNKAKSKQMPITFFLN